MDKRERARIFRVRLDERMKSNGMSRSALARACGVDRSTIAQLLSADETRLPNSHLAAECARALGASADWLLGLADRSETAADILAATFRFTEAERTSADIQIAEWHREATGYKIRHVPATLPDTLKTDTVLDFEYAAFQAKTPAQAGQASKDLNDWLSAPGSDYEICVPREQVESLARGEGYWRGLSKSARREQIEHMAERCRALYPSLRFYMFDSKTVFSAPVTIFGPLLAVIYIGRYYMVLRERHQIQALTDHFDKLVYDAENDARSAADIIAGMI